MVPSVLPSGTSPAPLPALALQTVCTDSDGRNCANVDPEVKKKKKHEKLGYLLRKKLQKSHDNFERVNICAYL